MPYEVQGTEYELKAEHEWFGAHIRHVEEVEGKYGTQLKWYLELDEDRENPFTDDDGNEQVRQTWHFTSAKLTTHERNKFRQMVKWLTGEEPQKGEVFDERHYTREFYEQDPEQDPVKLTGREEPWRVRVMFEHYKKNDSGDMGERVSLIAQPKG